MLEVVGVNLTPRQRGVWQNVVLERFNLQLDPLLCGIGFACSRISACGTLDAPTVSVSAHDAKLRALKVAAASNVSDFFMIMVSVFY